MAGAGEARLRVVALGGGAGGAAGDCLQRMGKEEGRMAMLAPVRGKRSCRFVFYRPEQPWRPRRMGTIGGGVQLRRGRGPVRFEGELAELEASAVRSTRDDGRAGRLDGRGGGGDHGAVRVRMWRTV